MKLSRKRDAGFSLTETALALGIAAFCLLALLGLLPAGIQSSEAAGASGRAWNVASVILADLRADGTLSESPRFELPIPDPGNKTATLRYADSNGSLQVTKTSESQFQVKITLAAEPSPRTLVTGTIKIWPAVMQEKNASSYVEIPVALRR